MRGIDLWPRKAPDRDGSDGLLHPAQAFDHPQDVVCDGDLTPNEKRAILAAWASDVAALDAAPDVGCGPGGRHPVRFEDVMDALGALDHELHGVQASRRGSHRASYRASRRRLCRRRGRV